MELEKKYIHMSHEKSRAVSQITIDDDFNVPDYKPDFVKIIHDRGEVRYEEVKVTSGHVLIRGILVFDVLYRSDRKESRIAHLTGNVPFQETLVMDGVEDFDPVRLETEIEDLSIGIINSRKLSIRALLVMKASVKTIQDEELSGGVTDADGAQLLMKPHELLELVLSRKDTLRIRQELPLPSNKPNIQEILWQSVQIRGLETRLKDNELEVTGEILLGVIYEEEGEEGRLQWLEEHIPLSGSVECRECREDMVFEADIQPASVELEAKPDFDAEERMLSLDLVLDLNIFVWKEEQVEVLEDLYALDRKLTPIYADSNTERLLFKNSVKSRVNERIPLEGQSGEILMICTAEGNAKLEGTELTTEGIMAEGILEVTVLTMTQDDSMPVGLIKGLVPFEQLLEVPGIKENCRFEITVGIDQLSVSMADDSELEVKAVISLDVIAFAPESFPKISEIREEERDMEELQKMPGITGYMVRDGDSLWQIARDNATTMEDLMETNQLTTPDVKKGDKLLIVKKVSGKI